MSNDDTANSTEQYQNELLQGVARTFALTIAQLPDELRPVIANAYLLCRISDTIEDDKGMLAVEKRKFSRQFIEIVEGLQEPAQFASELKLKLSDNRLPAEKHLIQETGRVIAITRGFSDSQQKILARCVRTMAEGMSYYQSHENVQGLESMRVFDNYCYHVAGVVGEMLTELFCEYSSDFCKPKLLPLALSFGQGLQMVNILKDIWEDLEREVCWLPQDVFEIEGFSLASLSSPENGASRLPFISALNTLLAIAYEHLINARRFVLFIPKKETGIRRFCILAIGMALLTLQKIKSNPDYSAGEDVKISRQQVLLVYGLGFLAAHSNKLFVLFFSMWSRRLATPLNSVKTNSEHAFIAEWFAEKS